MVLKKGNGFKVRGTPENRVTKVFSTFSLEIHFSLSIKEIPAEIISES